MRLTFIHGWGFNRDFWQPLINALPHYECACIDCGYFGEPHGLNTDQPGILIGHSLGFMLGMRMKVDWQGWIAINGFPFFANRKERAGCAPPAMLRSMKKQLAQNPQKTLSDFYRQIGTTPFHQGEPNLARLEAGLDLLQHEDISDITTASLLPHMVLAGAEDPLVPISVSENLQTTRGVFYLHPSGDHSLPQSETTWCADKINQFLATYFLKA